MGFKKSVRNLSCMLLLGLGSPQLNANPQPELSQPEITYNFDEFFSRQFKSQDTVEGLINDSYIRYHSLIKDAREKNPGQIFTLQSLLDNSSLRDKGRFFGLAWNYMCDMKKFGYDVDGFPEIEGNLFKLNLIDKKKTRIKLEMNMGSSSEFIDTEEIIKFLNDSRHSFFLYDSQEEGIYLCCGYKSNI